MNEGPNSPSALSGYGNADQGESTCHYRIETNPASNKIVVKIIGFWEAGIAERFLRDLAQTAQNVRQAHGRIRLLFDLTKADVLLPALAEHMRDGGRSLRQPDDRVAIVTESALATMQVKRLTGPQELKIASSVEEAEAWLENLEGQP